MNLRPYQQTTVDQCRQLLSDGKKTVCIVAPTGSGKTVIGQALTNDETIWIVHRVELLEQTKQRLNTSRVYTIQSLLGKKVMPDEKRVIFDECHHFPASQWGLIFNQMKKRGHEIIGLTATPQRADGLPLGDLFDDLIVAANYSELIEQGHIVECDVLHPEQELESGFVAAPLQAYQEFGEQRSGFVFCPTIVDAEKLCAEFNEAGIPSACVTSKTDPEDRAKSLQRFKNGEFALMFNVFVLTEGVDVPHASICILARGCGHQSTYLQMVGRVLRPYPTKKRALLLDLAGVSNRLGSPTEDRYYSLDGTGIRRKIGETHEGVGDDSIELKQVSDTEFIVKGKLVKLYSERLIANYKGSETPSDDKRKEWERLEQLCEFKGYGIEWALKKYKETFGRPPPVADRYKAQVKANLTAIAKSKGYKEGWIWFRMKSIF